jgi:putative spermidine/putrescine transport system permease protein
MRRLPALLIFTLVGAFLLAPLIIVAGVSLNGQKRLVFPPREVSLGWYGELATSPAWLLPIGRSLLIAFLSALVAVSIALPVAYYVWRFHSRWARALYGLGISPFILPPVICGLGFLIFWASVGHFGRFENVVLGHGVFLVALPLTTLLLGFEGIGRESMDAAETMGASEWVAFRTVVLPLALPYLISGYAFAFVLSLNEYIIAYMIAGFSVETLPIKIFNSLRYGYTPIMAVVSVLFLLISVAILALVARVSDLTRLMGALEPERK